MVAGVPGIERVRFVTCYPGDFTDDIFEAMRDLPEVCEYLHIPAQSGSDAVLKRMRRRYTVGDYVDLIGRGRDFVPGLAVASDFIVGFCGETDKEHEASLRLIEQCRFKNIFVFKYSERPGTVAQKRTLDDVPQEVKRRRTDQLVGRTRSDRIVVFSGRSEHIGRFADVRITAATALTLHGTLIEKSVQSPIPGGTTGGTRGAADGEKRDSFTSISGSPVSRSLPVIGSV